MSAEVSPALINALKHGDEKALGQIFDIYKDRLYAYCFRMLKTKDLSDEVVADVFITLWNKREHLLDSTSFEAYLVTIARNLSIDSIKRAVRDEKFYNEILLGAILTHSQLDENIDYEELQMTINEAIENLPPQRKQIFLMSRENSFSHQEIADKLKLSKNTVKDQIVKALADIRAHLYMRGYTDLPMVVVLLLLNKR